MVALVLMNSADILASVGLSRCYLIPELYSHTAPLWFIGLKQDQISLDLLVETAANIWLNVFFKSAVWV